MQGAVSAVRARHTMEPDEHWQVWRIHRPVQAQAEGPCRSWYLLVRHLFHDVCIQVAGDGHKERNAGTFLPGLLET